MTDDTGENVADLAAKKDGARLAIKDSNGKIRLFIGLAKGNPSILFADKDENVVTTYAKKNGSFETTN